MRQVFAIETTVIPSGHTTRRAHCYAQGFQIDDAERVIHRANQVGRFLAERDEHVDSIKHEMHAHT
ncbi:hypothetical protein D9M69_623560 [compost metagenome]